MTDNGQVPERKVLTLSKLQERGLTRPDAMGEIDVPIEGVGIFHCEVLSAPVLTMIRGLARDGGWVTEDKDDASGASRGGGINWDLYALFLLRFSWVGLTPVGSTEREDVDRTDRVPFKGPTPDGSGLLHAAPFALVNAVAEFAPMVAIGLATGMELTEEDRARLLFPDGSQTSEPCNVNTSPDLDPAAAAISADNGADPSMSG